MNEIGIVFVENLPLIIGVCVLPAFSSIVSWVVRTALGIIQHSPADFAMVILLFDCTVLLSPGTYHIFVVDGLIRNQIFYFHFLDAIIAGVPWGFSILFVERQIQVESVEQEDPPNGPIKQVNFHIPYFRLTFFWALTYLLLVVHVVTYRVNLVTEEEKHGSISFHYTFDYHR